MDLSRALEERNKELEGLRRQLAREEEEKHELFAQINSLIREMAQLRQTATETAENEEGMAVLQKEMDELKLDFGRKQGELQKVQEELLRERGDFKRRENVSQLERHRMAEELRERDDLLKELTETGDELGRALNEANTELQNTREQLDVVQRELALAQQRNKQPTPSSLFSENQSIFIGLESEEQTFGSTKQQMEQLKTELAESNNRLKLAEQRVDRAELELQEKNKLLSQQSNDLQMADQGMALARKGREESERRALELDHRLSESLEKIADLKEKLEETKLELKAERERKFEELEREKANEEKEAASIAVAQFEERLRIERIAAEKRIAHLEQENFRLSSQLSAMQKSAENSKIQLLELEEQKSVLTGQLEASQKIADSKFANLEERHEKELQELMEESERDVERCVSKIDQLEAENANLAAELLGTQQRAERDSRHHRNELETLKAEAAREKEQNRCEQEEHRRELEQKIKMLEEAAATGKSDGGVGEWARQTETPPTAKPRKTLNGNGGNGGEVAVDDLVTGQQREMATLRAELEKQRRLVTVLRKKLQQQQLLGLQ